MDAVNVGVSQPGMDEVAHGGGLYPGPVNVSFTRFFFFLSFFFFLIIIMMLLAAHSYFCVNINKVWILCT